VSDPGVDAGPPPDPTGPGLPGVAARDDRGRACLVHITDLHVGPQFNDVVWEGFLAKCAELGPDILLVTGDLVDSPWRWSRWSLRSARERLREARRQAESAGRDAGGTGGKPCRLLVVPGWGTGTASPGGPTRPTRRGGS
jgi:hypothetical protein